MVVKTRHTGIVVSDLESSISFYLGLGMELFSREIEQGPFIDSLVGIPNVQVEWAKLKMKDDSLLELLKYHSHPVESEHRLQRANQPGCSHIAFTVENIDETVSYFDQSGGKSVRAPQTSPNGLVKVVYCHDPEGNIVEIVEELKLHGK